jgi:hypothetical protein
MNPATNAFCHECAGSVAGCLYECGCSPPRAQTPARIAETGQTAGERLEHHRRWGRGGVAGGLCGATTPGAEGASAPQAEVTAWCGMVSELIERVVAHHWALSSMPAHALSRTVVFQPFPAASTVVHFLRSRVAAWGHGEESGRGKADLFRFAEPAGLVSPGSLRNLCFAFALLSGERLGGWLLGFDVSVEAL